MKWLILSLSLLASIATRAQKVSGKPGPFAQIDAKAVHWPDSVTSSADRLGDYVAANFSTPEARTRAIFIWIANNIQYDIANMFAINFYEDANEKIAKPLRTHKGICENYAALFVAVCQRAGVRAVEIQGYTKQRGFVDFIPHAWCGAFLDGTWWLFDPTWGAGYVEQGKFVRKLNESYFKASPYVFIKTHMPFDYLWEMLYYPVTNQDFYEGRTVQDKNRPYFNFPDSIKAYEALSPEDREAAEAVRVERNGTRNSMIFDRLRHLKVDLENYRRLVENQRQQAEVERQNGVIYAYNSVLGQYNNAIRQFNNYINYYNAQFKPEKPDAEIQQMLDSADHELTAARSGANAIVVTPADNRVRQPLSQLKDAMAELATHVKEQQEWLTRYLGKGKLGRKMAFRKYSWFGVPLN
ncbi:MAG TPA: transglutaminase domain-containing protein [Puia sp.]|uniref:transglutaminase domain-containing protein n=1 Tax=Puia sp. TaxID=2045100 RepID=UPI002C6A5A69|nr:transglutaminase domain-containing protein [Puia sp.]HVU95559.1 transglutaminase domain-containing protein [Puia sp.]